MKTILISIKQMQPNTGQVDGLPKNPRFIKDEKFRKMVKSIQDDPEMLELRECIVFPHKDKFVIIAGDKRYRACLELGYTEMPCKVLPKDYPLEKVINVMDIEDKDVAAFTRDFNNPGSAAAKAYKKGQDKADYNIDIALFEKAKNGDLKALQRYEERKFLNHKKSNSR